MSKLASKQKAEVITDFASGKTKSEIAKKFNVSITAISKILKNEKSLEEVQKSSKSSKELRTEIKEKATLALYEKDFDKLAPETLLKIIERLSILDPVENQCTNRPVIEFIFKDTSTHGTNNNT